LTAEYNGYSFTTDVDPVRMSVAAGVCRPRRT